MMNCRSILLRFKAAATQAVLALTVMPLTAYAQLLDSDEYERRLKDIYQIEMIVFANNNALANVDQSQFANDYRYSEKWRPADGLQYPENLAFILNNEDDALLQEWQDLQDLNSAGETGNSNQSGSPVSGLETTEALPPIDSSVSEPSLTAEAEAPPEQFELPALMKMLPREARTLNGVASPIDRRSAHRVLFHNAWLQELDSTKKAPAIPVAGGDRFDQQHELAGSVSFSKGRFLHIATDLWLSQYNQPGYREPGYADANQANFGGTFLPLPPTNPALEAARRGIESARNVESEAQAFAAQQQQFQQQNRYALQRYQPSQTFVLKERRKLRRNELHYLDHPMFGVIVQISKYEPADSP